VRGNGSKKAYIVGSGIAGLASAVYLIRDAGLRGENIRIFEEARDFGGALDASGDAASGYIMRGGRMFEEHYVCTYDLLSSIPSYDDPDISARDDIFAFSREASWHAKARLVSADGTPIDVTSMGFDNRDRLALLWNMLRSEASLGARRIDEVFPPHFFKTNFWLMWCTMFSFQPWHSAAEMRRYLLRFIHLFPTIADLSAIYHTRYNQYHSIVLPVQSWLQERGVGLENDTRVIDMALHSSSNRYHVYALTVLKQQNESEIVVDETDVVIFTNGSMTDASTFGSMTQSAALDRENIGGAWALWRKLAARHACFGRPEIFIGNIDKSKWLSFTVTTRLPWLQHLLERLTNITLGREGLITLENSNWLTTLHPHYYPAYPSQPEDAIIWWGYGLNPDRVGNFVQKRMADCTGEELLRETFSHLRFEAHLDVLMRHSRAIPCMMPYITSQFMPRVKGDRPEVVPTGSRNLAFIGQFTEVPDDVVFTVEYSVRTAKMAVKALLGLDVTIPPVHKGWQSPSTVLAALGQSLR
jgi:oleate hydratase